MEVANFVPISNPRALPALNGSKSFGGNVGQRTTRRGVGSELDMQPYASHIVRLHGKSVGPLRGESICTFERRLPTNMTAFCY